MDRVKVRLYKFLKVSTSTVPETRVSSSFWGLGHIAFSSSFSPSRLVSYVCRSVPEHTTGFCYRGRWRYPSQRLSLLCSPSTSEESGRLVGSTSGPSTVYLLRNESFLPVSSLVTSVHWSPVYSCSYWMVYGRSNDYRWEQGDRGTTVFRIGVPFTCCDLTDQRLRTEFYF